MRFHLALALAALLAATLAGARDRIPLADAADPVKGWAFDNGQEFPGAKGRIDADAGTLKLTGDFTGGGGYVQAQRPIPDIDVRELSFEIRAEGSEEFTLRLGDGSGQCHQIELNDFVRLETS